MRTRLQQVLGEGLFTGIVGYAVVALFFAAENMISGQSPFHTAATLGGPLVAGTPEEQEAVAAIFAYNGLHLLVFVFVGTVAAWIVTTTERFPVLWYLAFFAFFMGFAYDLVLLMLFVGPTQDPGWISVLSANALAALAMGGYLWAVHPGLWEEIRQRGDPEREHPSPGSRP